jgi:hypothetical protein
MILLVFINLQVRQVYVKIVLHFCRFLTTSGYVIVNFLVFSFRSVVLLHFISNFIYIFMIYFYIFLSFSFIRFYMSYFVDSRNYFNI